MTVIEMLAQLKVRLEDPDEAEFTETVKLQMLNDAQGIVVVMLNNAYLTELEVWQDYSKTHDELGLDTTFATGGVMFLSVLTYPPRGGSAGIEAIRIHASEKFATKLEISDVKILDNTMIEVASDEPYYIVFADRIQLLPNITQHQIKLDVLYHRDPLPLTKLDSFDNEFTSMLNPTLHPLIVGLAEAFCWTNSEDTARSEAVKVVTMAQIDALNTRYQQE